MRSEIARASILCCNMGSSSLKFALYPARPGDETLFATGEIERIGLEGGRCRILDGRGGMLLNFDDTFDEERAVATLFSSFEKLHLPKPAAVGHRVVHGGASHDSPVLIEKEVIGKLRDLVPFAPLHMPAEIRTIEAVSAHFPDIPQVACFDTAFHRRMPGIAQRLPLPSEFWQSGVRRYGFHGLSYEYIVHALGRSAHGRVIIAHLGNGSSMAAVRGGDCLDTTMGFTPTGGLMMGTRTGDLDPGVLLYLMREHGYDERRIDELVNRKSGLLGVSEATPDMKTLLEKRKRDPEADMAVRMFCYQIQKFAGALAAVLGGVDVLVFTGGIGEHAAQVRAEVCEGLSLLGIAISPEKNAANAEVISKPESGCSVRVIRTNEELMIARHTKKVVGL